MPVTLMTVTAHDAYACERVVVWRGFNSRTPEGTDRLLRELKELHPHCTRWQVSHELPDGAEPHDPHDDHADVRVPDVVPEEYFTPDDWRAVKLTDLDFNEKAQHDEYAAGVRTTEIAGLDGQIEAAAQLNAALAGNNRLAACYWLGRLQGLVTAENGYTP